MLCQDPKRLERKAATSTVPLNGDLQGVVADAKPDAGAPDSITDLKWERLVKRIQAGDPRALEELHEIMNGGVRFLLVRQLPFLEVDDRIQDIFMIVLRAIQTNQLREPARLLGFILKEVHRQIDSSIDDAVRARLAHVPLGDHLGGPAVADSYDAARQVMLREHAEILSAAFSALSETDQQILRRYYIENQPMEVICEQMNLTLDQFRLCKSRAKEKFGQAAREILHPLRIRFGMAKALSASTTGSQRGLIALARAGGMK